MWLRLRNPLLSEEIAPGPPPGRHPATASTIRLLTPPSIRRARVAAFFQAGLGLIFLAVFLSLSVQLVTLIGSRGLLPLQAALDSVPRPGLSAYLNFPTLFWLARSDAAIRTATWAGAAISLALLAGVAPRVAAFLLGTLFLTCITAGRDFFQYQWDNLLMEAVFLCLLLPASGGLLALTRPARLRQPAPAVVFLFRWLLFRVLFESALAKIQSGEGTWWNLTGMSFYYETAPLPSWCGWLVQQAPMWFHRVSVVYTFLVELVLAPLAFAPRRFRLVLFFANAAFQASIFLTANYGYFNPLSLVISLFLLEDRDLEMAGRRTRAAALALRQRMSRVRALLGRVPDDGCKPPQPRELRPPGISAGVDGVCLPLVQGASAAAAAIPSPPEAGDSLRAAPPVWRRMATRAGWGVLMAFIVVASLLEAAVYFLPRAFPGSIPALRALAPLRFYEPFRIVEVYHLFPGILRERAVIEVNATRDGLSWSPYYFRYAPGDPKVAPPTTGLHNPRFAFHYSFLPLNRRRDLEYFNILLQRLCCEPEAVADLLAANPFPGERPLALRIDFYRYRFGDLDLLRRTGGYWVREFLGSHRQVLQCRCAEPVTSDPGAPGPPPPAPAPR